MYIPYVDRPEPFVDAERAAEFLSVTPRYLIGLARKGHIPAHPLGSGQRKQWRFRLSEIADALAAPSEAQFRRRSSASETKG